MEEEEKQVGVDYGLTDLGGVRKEGDQNVWVEVLILGGSILVVRGVKGQKRELPGREDRC